MNPLNAVMLVYGAIILWFVLHYFYTSIRDRDLRKLREYDRQCQIESERKARDER